MRLSLVAVCALIASACGQMPLSPSAATGVRSDPLPLEAICSSDAPGDFVVHPRNGNAYLSWSGVTSAHAYEVEIYQIDSDRLVADHTLSDTQWEWGAHGLGQGPYRARVRMVTECGRATGPRRTCSS